MRRTTVSVSCSSRRASTSGRAACWAAPCRWPGGGGAGAHPGEPRRRRGARGRLGRGPERRARGAGTGGLGGERPGAARNPDALLLRALPGGGGTRQETRGGEARPGAGDGLRRADRELGRRTPPRPGRAGHPGRGPARDRGSGRRPGERRTAHRRAGRRRAAVRSHARCPAPAGPGRTRGAGAGRDSLPPAGRGAGRPRAAGERALVHDRAAGDAVRDAAGWALGALVGAGASAGRYTPSPGEGAASAGSTPGPTVRPFARCPASGSRRSCSPPSTRCGHAPAGSRRAS